MPIHCTLFASNLAPIDNAFRQGDIAVIVIADTQKVISTMDGAINYYENSGKIEMHGRYLLNGRFEIPLVALSHSGKVGWIEGIHQVNAAFQQGQGVIPISTASRYAEALKNLVGADDPEFARMQFDFSACRGAAIY